MERSSSIVFRFPSCLCPSFLFNWNTIKYILQVIIWLYTPFRRILKRLQRWFNHSTPSFFFLPMIKTCAHTNGCTKCSQYLNHNQKRETIQMSFAKYMDKHNVKYSSCDTTQQQQGINQWLTQHRQFSVIILSERSQT